MIGEDWDEINYLLHHYGCGGCSNPGTDEDLKNLADKMMTWLAGNGIINLGDER